MSAVRGYVTRVILTLGSGDVLTPIQVSRISQATSVLALVRSGAFGLVGPSKVHLAFYLRDSSNNLTKPAFSTPLFEKKNGTSRWAVADLVRDYCVGAQLRHDWDGGVLTVGFVDLDDLIRRYLKANQ